MNSADLRPVLDINIINFKLKIFEITTLIYLLLAEFEGCTVIYGPRFPPLIYGEKWGFIIYRLVRYFLSVSILCLLSLETIYIHAEHLQISDTCQNENKSI